MCKERLDILGRGIYGTTYVLISFHTSVKEVKLNSSNSTALFLLLQEKNNKAASLPPSL
jgi:hypothetical protein